MIRVLWETPPEQTKRQYRKEGAEPAQVKYSCADCGKIKYKQRGRTYVLCQSCAAKAVWAARRAT
jgi:DNA-directed RNA polymerase subunit RPC12/RpoP